METSRWKRLGKVLAKLSLFTIVQEVSNEEDKDSISAISQKTDEISKLGLPAVLPTILEIKRVIPSHCFQPTVARSMFHAMKDVVFAITLYFVGEFLLNYLPFWAVLASAPVFWFVQGTIFTAIFVIGHDCGHGSFSKHDLLNDIVGTIMHSFLMTPYYGWKISHKNHHKNTGNIDKDEVFYPVRKSLHNGSQALPGFGFGLGYYGYLVLGYNPRPVQHYNPFQKFYSNHVVGCCLSILTLTLWSSFVYQFYMNRGFFCLFYHYLVPLFIFASYTVIITFLHHTEEDIPWYGDDKWDNVRGQLSSVDRHYGIIHAIIHNITTHQIHHLFPKVPHYHLEEATQHFRAAFPELVNIRTDSALPAFWRMFKKYTKQCIISDDTQMHIYK